MRSPRFAGALLLLLLAPLLLGASRPKAFPLPGLEASLAGIANLLRWLSKTASRRKAPSLANLAKLLGAVSSFALRVSNLAISVATGGCRHSKGALGN